MKFSIIFIIGFIQFISCCDINITGGSYSDCPYNLFRRKRSIKNNEYTRWRANVETTQEFVVKVLDEDLTTAVPKKVIAINIQPVTKGEEKIIIGGAMVPKPADLPKSSELINEYTRFVPPTTILNTKNQGGGMYHAPVPIIVNEKSVTDKHKLQKPHGRNPQRDESPPAAPQFLPRLQIAHRQYAPITPVGFTRRLNTFPPVTPSTTTLHTLRPSQRTSIPDLIIPSRSKLITEDFSTYQEVSTEIDDFITKLESSTGTEYYPYITTTSSKPLEVLADSEIIDSKTSESKDNNKEESYNSMFYYDEVDKINKKTRKGGLGTTDEAYEDKINDLDNTLTQQTEGLEEKSTESNEKIVELNDNDEPEYKEIPISADNNLSDNTADYSNNETAKDIPAEKLRDKRRPFCSMLKLRQLNFNSPRTLPEIVAQLSQWAEESPVAKWVDITDGNLTTMENPIYMMIVDDPSSGQIISAKQTVMIIAGIQGRDQHAVASAMYVLYQLIERSESHTDLLTKYRFWVIPVFNPDGYDYAMTFPHRREWTKNLRQNWDVCKGRESCQSCETYGLRCTVQPCYGVNLDRNFEYQWIPTEELLTEHPCGGLYAGPRQLSESETRAFTNYLHQQRTPIFTFIALKEGDVLGIMYPYSHTRKRRSFDHVYRQRAARAAAAAYSISGRPYVAGQTSEFLPLYAGGVEDWIDGHMGIDNTYTIMMFRPADAYNNKLITERVVHEAYAAMDTLVLQSVEPLAAPAPVRVTEAKSAAQTILIHTIVIFISIIIQYLT